MASRRAREQEIEALQRKAYLLRLKAKITYKGPDPQLQAEKLYWLARTCGYYVHHPHLQIIEHQNLTAFGDRDADMTLGARGFGKSTAGTIVRAIAYHLDNPNWRILLVSDTQTAAERLLREIRTILQTNRDLIDMFGRFFGADRYSDLGRYRDSYATTLLRTDPTISEATFTCLGVGGQAASMHFEVIILDDLVTIRNSRTKKQRDNLTEWHGSTMLGCALETTKTHYVGTRYYPNDQYQVLDQGRIDEDAGVLFGATLKIPALVVGADGQETSNYPERFTTAHLQKRRRKMGRYHFNAQMQQDTSSADGMVFRYPEFKWYGTDDADRAAVPKGLGIYQYTDLPAKRTSAGDFMATVTIGVTPGREIAERQIYVLDLVHERCGMGKMRTNIADAVRKWNPVQHGVEAVAMQAGFAQEMQERIDRRIQPVEVETDKFFRAQRVAPCFEFGQVYFPMPDTARGKAMAVLIEELCTFPDGDNDDCVDAVVGAITLALFSGRAASWGEDEDGDQPADDEGGGAVKLRGRY